MAQNRTNETLLTNLPCSNCGSDSIHGINVYVRLNTLSIESLNLPCAACGHTLILDGGDIRTVTLQQSSKDTAFEMIEAATLIAQTHDVYFWGIVEEAEGCPMIEHDGQLYYAMRAKYVYKIMYNYYPIHSKEDAKKALNELDQLFKQTKAFFVTTRADGKKVAMIHEALVKEEKRRWEESSNPENDDISN